MAAHSNHILGTVASTVFAITAIGCTSANRYTSGESNLQSIVVSSYNIKHGVGMDGVLDLERTSVALAGLDADIIALQEVDEFVSRSGGIDQATWLGEKLGMESAFGSFMDFQGGRYGLAILSRFPIEHSEIWRLANGNEPRVALAVRIRPTFGKSTALNNPITFVVVHFDWVGDDTFRFTQASQTIEHIQALDTTTPWVVLGDFNDTPTSRTMRAFFDIGKNAAKRVGESMTFPANAPNKEIDFIIAGPPVRWKNVRSVVVDEPTASDHLPVAATLTLRNERPPK
jgi:endonuclease/exonuclease/phosphatase family metal-dependent hydrolase